LLSVWKDRACHSLLQYGAVCRCSHKQRGTYAPLSEIREDMQVGDLVRHNGSGPVGWKMQGAIGLITKHEVWTKGGEHISAEWRIQWVSKWVTDWYKDILWYGTELEVISESR
jgi:hypothetical protein